MKSERPCKLIILSMSLLHFWTLIVVLLLLSTEDQRALGFNQKYLHLCPEDERKFYGFGTKWGWVINDRIVIFGSTIPLSVKQCLFKVQLSSLSLRRDVHRMLAKRLMHMVHLSGNTSGVSKSSVDWLNYTGFPSDVCVVFFNVPPGNKDTVAPNPLTKEESRRVYNWRCIDWMHCKSLWIKASAKCKC